MARTTFKTDPNGDSFKRPRAGGKATDVADWGSVDAAVLVHCIEIAAKQGGALRLGYTRDGGAYAIGVYAGATYFTDYVRPNEDIDQYLRDLTESFSEYSGDAGSGPSPSGSKRR